MKALLTGGTGFLGRHLAAALARDGVEVTALGSADADLTIAGSLDRIAGRFDTIWHLAAWTQAGDFCLRHPADQWVINQRINTNVLDWWRTRQPQAKLVAIGTSCSYAPDRPLVESEYLAGDPVPELYAYAMTKRMLLVGLRALAAQDGLRFLYLVPSTLFGSAYHTDARQRHFIFDLVAKILAGRHHGAPVVLWGDGHQRRELVFIDDFVRAALRLVRDVDDEIVNIGSGAEQSIRWYAGEIARLVGFDPARIVYDESRYVGVRSKQLVVDKLRRLLPDFKLTPIEASLARTVAEWSASCSPEQPV